MCLRKRGKVIILGRLFRLFLISLMLFKNRLSVQARIPVDGHSGPADVCVIELGGTIGDIESMPFIEALGQFSYRVGSENFCLIHVSLVPVLNVVCEQKTKPTQHSVRDLSNLKLYKAYMQEYLDKYDSYCPVNKILESYRNDFQKLGEELEFVKGRGHGET